jgi:hypothetical protein
MTQPDIPLLRKAVEWVEEQEQLLPIDREWDQEHYQMTSIHHAMVLLGGIPTQLRYLYQVAAHCGSTYCVAGYIGQMLDARYRDTTVVEGVHVAEFAMEQLRLTPIQGRSLFAANNSAADVRQIAENIAGQPL